MLRGEKQPVGEARCGQSGIRGQSSAHKEERNMLLVLDGLQTALPGTLPCAPAGTWPSILCNAGARGKAALSLSCARSLAGAKTARPGHCLCPEYS